jgi:hypothetical protein
MAKAIFNPLNVKFHSLLWFSCIRLSPQRPPPKPPGRRAARSIARYLKNTEWPANRLEVRAKAPLAWVCPNAIEESDDVAAFQFRSYEFKKNVQLEVKQGRNVLQLQPFRQLGVNEIMGFKGGWTRKIDPNGEAITIGLQARE